MIPEGFILSDIALAVIIVLFFGGMTLMIISMCIEQVLNSIIKIKRELLTDEEE